MLCDDLDSSEGRRASARLGDAYLEPFHKAGDAADHPRLVAMATWVGQMGRALDWDRMLVVAAVSAVILYFGLPHVF